LKVRHLVGVVRVTYLLRVAEITSVKSLEPPPLVPLFPAHVCRTYFQNTSPEVIQYDAI